MSKDEEIFFMDYPLQPWSIITKNVLKDPAVDDGSKILYGCLINFVSGPPTGAGKKEFLKWAEMLGITLKEIERRFEVLSRAGYVFKSAEEMGPRPFSDDEA